MKAAYRAIYLKLENHLKIHHKLRLFIAYELFNTATAKFLFDVIKMINNHKSKDGHVSIHWIVKNSNQDMVDTAHDYQVFCNFPFELIIID
ncbi:MAG: SiaC family regulatory phosphoprotein [Cyclobacteriaceae bacterium]